MMNSVANFTRNVTLRILSTSVSTSSVARLPTSSPTSFSEPVITNVSNATNSTTRPPGVAPTPFSEIMAWSIALGILAVMAILGNSMVIAVFTQNRKLHTRTNYFVVGLAAADLLVGLFPIPMYISILFYSYRGKLSSNLMDFFTAFDIFGSFASIFQLTMIGLERYYAIVHPVSHRNSNKWLYLCTLAFVWLLSATLSVMHAVSTPRKRHAFTFLMLVLTCLSITVIFFAYVGILRRAKKRSKQKHRRRKKQDQEVLIALTILMLFAVFIITWLPFFIIILIYYFDYSLGETIPLFAVQFTKLLHYSNSAINPIIYSLKIPGFKSTFTSLIRRETRRSVSRSFNGSLIRRDSSRKSPV